MTKGVTSRPKATLKACNQSGVTESKDRLERHVNQAWISQGAHSHWLALPDRHDVIVFVSPERPAVPLQKHLSETHVLELFISTAERRSMISPDCLGMVLLLWRSELDHSDCVTEDLLSPPTYLTALALGDAPNAGNKISLIAFVGGRRKFE